MKPEHTSCAGEPLSMWCAPCRLARLVAEIQRDLGAAQIALARAASPEHRKAHPIVDELRTVGAHLKMAKSELADAISLAQDMAEEKQPA